MNLLLLADMAAAGRPDAIVVEAGHDRLTAADLLRCAWTAATDLDTGVRTIAYVGTNGLAFPIAIFAASAARVPFAPLNYRLSVGQLDALLRQLESPLVIAEGSVVPTLRNLGHRVVLDQDFVRRARLGADVGEVPTDSNGAAALLFTSGTTAAPKAAILSHRNLTSYVLGTMEFGTAGEDEAVLVSVPPYHIAGLVNVLSNLYVGRRIVYLRQFGAKEWVDAVRANRITHAMVVPTMLSRIADLLEADGGGLRTLRTLSYGGAKTPSTVLRRIMSLLPDVALTNAYGLTETSSTIAVLGPDDHRAAADGDSTALARLASAGKVLPTVELEVRGPDGPVQNGEPGEIWVRGDQVSGDYSGTESPRDDDGWFPTRDRGWLDPDGYLYIEGRADDTIIRGGENIAPAEIEEALRRHPGIADCAVVGIPDDEWGQQIAVLIIRPPGVTLDAASVRAYARHHLRSSKTPKVVMFDDALPYTETGKLVRREVQRRIAAAIVAVS